MVNTCTRRKKPPTNGFIKNHSTTDVLKILNTHIIEAIRKKEYSAMLSLLDISRAYDSCWRREISKKNKDMENQRKDARICQELDEQPNPQNSRA
jgi:hypothetical protein